MVIYTVLAKKSKKSKKIEKIKNLRNNFWGPCQVLNIGIYQTQKRSSCYRALLKLIET